MESQNKTESRSSNTEHKFNLYMRQNSIAKQSIPYYHFDTCESYHTQSRPLTFEHRHNTFKTQRK